MKKGIEVKAKKGRQAAPDIEIFRSDRFAEIDDTNIAFRLWVVRDYDGEETIWKTKPEANGRAREIRQAWHSEHRKPHIDQREKKLRRLLNLAQMFIEAYPDEASKTSDVFDLANRL